MTLILESCTERGIVAFAEGETLDAVEKLPFGYNNSRFLLPAVEKVLKGRMPEKIVIGVGPGSYTGIRIGATAAKTLAYTWNIPLFPVSTLAGFDGIGIIDAKISGAYLRLPGGEPIVCPLDTLGDVIPDGVALLTPNAGRLKEKVEALHPGRWTWEETNPDPLLLLFAAKKSKPHTHEEVELLYLRKTQAELERNGKGVVNS